MTLSTLDAVLRALCADTYHGGAPRGKTKYIVYAEYGQTDVRGDNAAQIHIPKVQIDAYCQDPCPSDPGGWFVSILDTLDAAGVPYGVSDMGYDPDAEAMRMIVQCEVA